MKIITRQTSFEDEREANVKLCPGLKLKPLKLAIFQLRSRFQFIYQQLDPLAFLHPEFSSPWLGGNTLDFMIWFISGVESSSLLGCTDDMLHNAYNNINFKFKIKF